MPESLVFSCAKILFLVSLFFVEVKDQSLLTFQILNFYMYINLHSKHLIYIVCVYYKIAMTNKNAIIATCL